MQVAPYSATPSVRTILNNGCSMTFIVVNVAGEAADGLAVGAGEEEGGGHGDDKAGEGDGGEDGFEPAGGGEFGGEGALEDDPDGLSVGRGDGAEGGDVFFAAQGDVDGGEGA